MAFNYNPFHIKFMRFNSNKFPMAKTNNSELARSIIFASFVIAGSLVSTAIFLVLYLPSFLLALASLFMAWYVQ